jgi:hypothetical protein
MRRASDLLIRTTPPAALFPPAGGAQHCEAMYKCALTVILHAVYIMLMTKKVAEVKENISANRKVKRAKLHVRGRRFGRNTSRQNGIE